MQNAKKTTIVKLFNHVCELNKNQWYGKYARAFINDVPVSALIDSGNSAGNCISLRVARALGLTKKDIEPMDAIIGTAKEGANLEVLGRPKKNLHLRFGGMGVTFRIRPFVIKGFSTPMNIS